MKRLLFIISIMCAAKTASAKETPEQKCVREATQYALEVNRLDVPRTEGFSARSLSGSLRDAHSDGFTVNTVQGHTYFATTTRPYFWHYGKDDGCYRNFNDHIIIHRLTATGTADPSYHPLALRFPKTGYPWNPRRIEIDRQNHILIISTIASDPLTPTYSIGVIRLKPDGTLDKHYGDHGLNVVKVKLPNDMEDNFLSSVAFDESNRMLLGINVCHPEGYGYGPCLTTMTRLKPNGQPDKTFGTAGVVALDRMSNVSNFSGPLRVRNLPNHEIELVHFFDEYHKELSLYRFTERGLPDALFGTNGPPGIQSRRVRPVPLKRPHSRS